MGKAAKPLVVRTKRTSLVFVCGKCARKCEDGASIRKALKGALRDRAHAAGRRPGKLVETKCMGLCPKQAVAVVGGAVLSGGKVLLLRRVEDVAPGVDMLEGRAEPLAGPDLE